MSQGPTDPVIDEVREVRHRISERVGHDPARLVAYYMELQKQFSSRLVRATETEEAEFQVERTGSLIDRVDLHGPVADVLDERPGPQ